ncbi:hypothetical protein, partial [Kocuria rhizophila]|uniref:hypothetical protein n=1 Tax=Kocuria rhizophila TaxID=72000 RepID=UPI0011A17796
MTSEMGLLVWTVRREIGGKWGGGKVVVEGVVVGVTVEEGGVVEEVVEGDEVDGGEGQVVEVGDEGGVGEPGVGGGVVVGDQAG